MSHVRCPMCGLDKAASSFEPKELDPDIYVRQAHGLGYGGGFRYGPDQSVLGDDVFTPKVLNRCIALTRLFLEKQIITPQEVLKELGLGIPAQGLYKVIPFETHIDYLNRQIDQKNNQITSLKNGNLLIRSRSNRHEHEALKKKYETLRNEIETKKRVEKILRTLKKFSDSEIVLEEDWVLRVNEFNLFFFEVFCKIFYELDPIERGLLEKRIISNCIKLDLILSYFKTEPGIKSVSDVWSKKPSFLYYLVNNLPASKYNNNMNHLSDQDLIRETFASTQFYQNIVQIYLGETRPTLNQ